jgi:hypothetical protein
MDLDENLESTFTTDTFMITTTSTKVLKNNKTGDIIMSGRVCVNSKDKIADYSEIENPNAL